MSSRKRSLPQQSLSPTRLVYGPWPLLLAGPTPEAGVHMIVTWSYHWVGQTKIGLRLIGLVDHRFLSTLPKVTVVLPQKQFDVGFNASLAISADRNVTTYLTPSFESYAFLNFPQKSRSK
nr:unnamed protein product [Haemonchus contortus]